MSSSLVPEKPLLVYPSLAATLGLEESLMLCTLSDSVQTDEGRESQGFIWHQISREQLCQLFPFWQVRDMQRVCTSLRDKGVLITSSGSLEQSSELRFAFNEKVQQRMAQSAPKPSREQSTAARVTAHMPGHLTGQIKSHDQAERSQVNNTTFSGRSQHNASPQGFLSKNYISPNWTPDDNTLAQLAQHSMPTQFAREQVPEFITYWRDRGEAHHSWNSKFIQHALRQWRIFETKRHKQAQETPIDDQWQPNPDAWEILIERAGIKREFIEDAIPEFVLYWRERGESHRTWNTKFVQHVRMQWAKFTAAIEHNTEPRAIAPNWQPSEDVYDVLRLANIEIGFARSLIPEFVLYWRDRGALHGSWNTKYLQHIKYCWAQRHTANDSATNRQTRDIRLEEELTDRSWAN